MSQPSAEVEIEQRGSIDKEKQLTAVEEEIEPADSGIPEGHEPPTEEEAATLRKIADRVPKTAYLLCAVEFAERASYYGCSQVFSNFIQFPLPKGGNGAGAPPRGTEMTAGALNEGLGTSSALTLLLKFLSYTIPILGGWVADVYWGRYKTICIGVFIGGLGHFIMVMGALPSVLQAGNGMAPFVISIVVLAFGAGMFKSNILPTVADQYRYRHQYVKTLPKTGERVVVDPESTIQKVTLTFYALVNIGAFFGVATSYSEKYVGYWLAYALPGFIYILLPLLLWYGNKRTLKQPPGGSDLANVLKVLALGTKHAGFWRFGSKRFFEAAKPSSLAARGITTFRNKPIDWDDKFVDDVRRTIVACQVFLFYPIYNLNDGGIGNIQTSQGASMTTKGAPNDLLNNFNPLTIIVLVPILNLGFYPLLRRYNIHFGRISRITAGFIIAALSQVVGAVLQYYIYETSPCGYYATGCTKGTGVSPISVWWQVILYVMNALSECFANVTAYEIAYARSPPKMKGLVMSLFLFNTALSSALAIAVTPALKDPYLIWPFAACAIAGVVVSVAFWFLYRDMDKDEFMT